MTPPLYYKTAKGTEAARKAIVTKFRLAGYRARFFEGTKTITGAVPTLEMEMEFHHAVLKAARLRKEYAKEGVEGYGFYVIEAFLTEHFTELQYEKIKAGKVALCTA